MDIPKLERMVAIHEAGSFRKAARTLGMSQPALTWSIRQLEETLNARLFERGPRGIVPTALCDRLVRRARLILRERARMLADVADAGARQTIDLGVHPIMPGAAFARAVATFTEAWPGVTLRVREGLSSELVERLLGGELDFACCALPDEADHGDALSREKLGAMAYSVVADAAHPVFADGADGRARAGYRWVEFDSAIVGRFPGNRDIETIMADAGRDAGRDAGYGSVRTASMALVRLLVTQAGFIGLVADDVVADGLAAGTLRRLPDTGVTALPFGFVSRKDDFETTAVRALKAALAPVAAAAGADQPARNADRMAAVAGGLSCITKAPASGTYRVSEDFSAAAAAFANRT